MAREYGAMQRAILKRDALKLRQLLVGGVEGLDVGALLDMAAAGDDEGCLFELLPWGPSKERNAVSLEIAAWRGHAAIVKALIPVSDPMQDNSRALRMAALLGQVECVQALLPLSDAGAVDEKGQSAARVARSNGHDRVAELIEGFLLAKAEATSLSGACSSSSQKAPMSTSKRLGAI